MFLPTAVPRSAPFIQQAPAPARADQQGAVLLVEDEPSIARMLTGVFAHVGLTVIWARDVAEAVGLFEKNHQGIALAFVDCHQTELDGGEFCRRVRAVMPGLPVLVAGSCDQQSPAAGDPIVFIPKPYLPTEVAWQVRTLLRRDRA